MLYPDFPPRRLFPWSARQVLATLNNPVYLGKFAERDGVREGLHKPIIRDVLFRQVWARVEKTSREAARPKLSKMHNPPHPGEVLRELCLKARLSAV